MFTPQLTVPLKQDNRPKDLVEPRHDKVRAWLDELPLANPFDSLRLVGHMLSQWNSLSIPFERRFAAMELVLPLIDELSPSVRREYGDAQIPLSDRKKQRANLMQGVWTETAHGYKSIIMEMMLTTQSITNPHEILVPSVFRAVRILTEELLERYLTFSAPLTSTWFEINQLYQFALTHSLTEVPVTCSGSEGRASSIDRAYRQALLLHLSDPYHLIPGEAARLYDELFAWTPLATVTPINNSVPPKGNYFVNFKLDCGPTFASQEAGLKTIEYGVSVDTRKMYAAVKNRLDSNHNDTKNSAQKQSTLGDRMLRERYLRLARAWSPRKERQGKRNTQVQQVMLASGFSACHQHASKGKAFEPEKDELRLQQVQHKQNILDDLEVLSDDEMPWIDEQKLTEINAGPGPARSAHFEGHSPNGQSGDWTNGIYSGAESARFADIDNAKMNDFTALCTAIDTSAYGLNLSYSLSATKISARVGDLVAFRELGATPDEAATGWHIGATRWLRCTNERDIEMGIERLSSDALPVATRALEGVGRGTDYFRGLIIPRRNPDEGDSTILTLPTVYDAGTVLLLNTGDQLFKIRLIHLVEGTNSFARYEYRLLDI